MFQLQWHGLNCINNSYLKASVNLPQRLTAVPSTFHHMLSTALPQSDLEPKCYTLSEAEDAAAKGSGRVRAVSASLGPLYPLRAPSWESMHHGASTGDSSSSCKGFLWVTLRAQPTICIFDQEFPGVSNLFLLTNNCYHTHCLQLCLESAKTKSTEALFFPQ